MGTDNVTQICITAAEANMEYLRMWVWGVLAGILITIGVQNLIGWIRDRG